MSDEKLVETVHQLVEDIGDEMNVEWLDPNDVIMLDDNINDEETSETESNIPFDLVLPKLNPLLKW